MWYIIGFVFKGVARVISLLIVSIYIRWSSVKWGKNKPGSPDTKLDVLSTKLPLLPKHTKQEVVIQLSHHSLSHMLGWEWDIACLCYFLGRPGCISYSWPGPGNWFPCGEYYTEKYKVGLLSARRYTMLHAASLFVVCRGVLLASQLGDLLSK